MKRSRVWGLRHLTPSLERVAKSERQPALSRSATHNTRLHVDHLRLTHLFHRRKCGHQVMIQMLHPLRRRQLCPMSQQVDFTEMNCIITIVPIFKSFIAVEFAGHTCSQSCFYVTYVLHVYVYNCLCYTDIV